MDTSHDTVIQNLLNDLQNGSIMKRRAAAYKLGKLKNPATVTALIEATNNPDPSVRQNAVNALREIKSEEALQFLATVHFAPTSKSSTSRASLLWGICLFLGINFMLVQARATLFRHLHSIGSPLWCDYQFDWALMGLMVVINLIIFIYLMIKHPPVGIGMLMGIPVLLILWYAAIILFYRPY
jgi:hypothetical protein